MEPRISHFASDGFDVWCLEDGTGVFDAATFPGCGFDEQQTRLSAVGETEIHTAFNAYLIRDAAGVTTLVDTGCGDAFGEKTGNLLACLAALQVDPADIQHLFFTHLHGDHCGGALHDGTPVFPNATVYVHADEQTYWADQDHTSQKVLLAYADRLQTIAGGDEIAPGLIAWALPGHTPGHMGLKIGTNLMLTGDLIHSEVLQLGDPRLCSVHDENAPVAVDSRIDGLRSVAANAFVYSGSHMRGPEKFARLVEIGDGFIRIGL